MDSFILFHIFHLDVTEIQQNGIRMTYVSLGNAARQLFDFRECRFQSSHVPDSALASPAHPLVEPRCFSGHVLHDCRVRLYHRFSGIRYSLR